MIRETNLYSTKNYKVSKAHYQLLSSRVDRPRNSFQKHNAPFYRLSSASKHAKRKVLPEPRGPAIGRCWSPYCSPQPGTSLRCETTDTGLMHHVVCLFTPQLLPVPSYTALWQSNMGVNNLPKVVTRQHSDQCSNSQPLSHQSDDLAIRLSNHSVSFKNHQNLYIFTVSVQWLTYIGKNRLDQNFQLMLKSKSITTMPMKGSLII